MADLSLFGSYTHSRLILIQILYLFRFLVCCTDLIHVLILISSLYLFRSPVGVTELMLKLRSLHLFGDTRRYHRDYRTYIGIAELILIRKYL